MVYKFVVFGSCKGKEEGYSSHDIPLSFMNHFRVFLSVCVFLLPSTVAAQFSHWTSAELEELIREQEELRTRIDQSMEDEVGQMIFRSGESLPVIPLTEECDPCDALRAEIAAKEQELEKKQMDSIGASLAKQVALLDVNRLEKELEAANRIVHELTNPRSWAESNGVRRDSADLRALEDFSNELWDSYQAGDMSAQEYENRLRTGMTDEEREARKQRMIADAKADAASLERKLSKAMDHLGQAMNKENTLDREIRELKQEIEELKRKLEDCVNQCKVGPVNLIDDFGLGQSSSGFLDWLSKLFGGSDSAEPRGDSGSASSSSSSPKSRPFPFTSDISVAANGIFPPIIIFPPLDVLSDEWREKCNPIKQLLKEAEKELEEMNKDLAELNQEAANAALDLWAAQDDAAQAQSALDSFNNPKSSASSGGRTIDSSDLIIIRMHNAELWQQYRDGDMTAAELEEAWGEGLSDADRERLKQEHKAKLEADLQAAQDALQKAQDALDALERIIADASAATDELVALIKNLKQRYEDCLKECMQKDTVIIGGELEFDDGRPGGLRRDIGSGEFDGNDRDYYDERDRPHSGNDGDVRFGDGIRLDGGETTDDIIKRSDEYDENTGRLPTGTNTYEYDDSGNLTVSNIGSSGEDGVAIDLGPEDTVVERQGGILCNIFGFFCPSDGSETREVPTEIVSLNLAGAIDCVQRPNVLDCDTFDHNSDGAVDMGDLSQWTPTLVGPNGLQFPLQINGMDGNDDLSIDDYSRLNDCLIGGPPSCNGLDFGSPGDDVLLGSTPGLGGNDFGLQLQNGNDILLGDRPGNDLINIGGGGNDILFGGPPPLSDDLPDIGDPFSGPLDGGIGLDILGEQPSAEPNMANDAQVRQVVAAAVAAYLRQNPLGECEKLVVTVRRVRIGNRVRYTVNIRRVPDPTKCPPDDEPLIFDPIRDFDSTNVLDPGDDLISAPPLDDPIISDPIDDFIGTGLPPAECPELSHGAGDAGKSACERVCSNGDCKSVNPIRGIGECWVCAPKEFQRDCTDFRNQQGVSYSNNRSECTAECSQECETVVVSDIGRECYYCRPTDPPPPPKEECPSGTDIEASGPFCSKCPSKECDNLKTLNDGTHCLRCLDPIEETPPPPQCDAPLVDHAGATALETDGFECSPVQVGSIVCYDCKEVDDGPTCPSGTTDSKSACESVCDAEGGTCVEENGCYSCLVVNCGPGAFKNECPSTCADGCDVVGQEGSVTCYACKEPQLSCEDLCAQHGFGPESTDHSNAILAELNGHSCVSGAGITIQTARVNDCNCIGDFSIDINTTVPTCDTPCGVIDCNSSTTCPGPEPNSTITATCSWGGWEKVQKHQFRPIFGN